MHSSFRCLLFVCVSGLVSAGILRHTAHAEQDPEVDMNPTQLITSKGYPCENHYPITDDGYILDILRISHGRDETEHTPRPVVFLQHGLIASATNWITNEANESFAFILADAGFDVWLGNSRGNKYSRGSIHLNPDEDEFWDFSWDQMAKYDLPAAIDYSLMSSGQEQLYYVGHSQGSTIGFAGFSKNKELASKVKQFFALGPVATVSHMTSPLRVLADFLPQMEFVLDMFGVQEFMPSSAVTEWFAADVCRGKSSVFCGNIIFVLCGFDEKNLNMSRIPVYLSHCPAGTSVQDLIHFAQMVNSGRFQAYDYGSEEENMKRYNRTTPTMYHPEDMNVPVSLYWGGQDWLADPTDVELLIPQLSDVLRENVELKDYDHMDFIWGMDAAQRVYQPIMEEIRKMEKELKAAKKDKKLSDKEKELANKELKLAKERIAAVKAEKVNGSPKKKGIDGGNGSGN